MVDQDTCPCWPLLDYDKQKKSIKAEDFIVVQDDLVWRGQKFAVFGVFDGHGGPQAGNECHTQIVTVLLQFLDKVEVSDHEVTTISWVEDILPKVLSETFQAVDKRCCEKFKQSGTTATVVVVSFNNQLVNQDTEHDKWAHVTVANVGDSHAYAQIGTSKPLRLNTNHRLDNNEEECKRIVAAGGEVQKASARSTDKKDPLRLWPGGLMMGRTLGDPDAIHSLGAPAVNNWVFRLFDEENDLTPVPCRIILASDGLWDAVGTKQCFSTGRKKSAQATAQALVKLAVKQAGADRDDIAIFVIDVCATPETLGSAARKRLVSTCSSTMSSTSNTNHTPSSQPRYFNSQPLEGERFDEMVKVFEAEVSAKKMRFEEQIYKLEQERIQLEKERDLELEHALLESAEEMQLNNIAAEQDNEWESVQPRQRKGSVAEHSEEPVVDKEEVDTARKVCFAFQKGKCKKHENCRYLHTIASQDDTKVVHEQETPEKPNKICKQFQKTKNSKNGDECSFAHDEQLTKSGKRKVCFEFKKTATCKKGDQCKFLHIAQPSHDKPVPIDATPEVGGSSKEAPRKPISKKICFEFKKQGSCPHGDNCRFSHNLEEALGEQESNLKKKPCFAFRKGKCKLGDECKFKHQAQDSKKPKTYDLFITGLNADATPKTDIRIYFSKFGKPQTLTVKFESKLRGYAFLTFEDKSSVEALLAVEEHMINDTVIHVKKFVPKVTK
uniref:Uncharacterized protein n=1 Tax=Mucochytrium quahogii TaxID=96639 RepID=A0A7S2WSN0_9STRA|mmetsp:Transcript_1643/g.2562  ORF Transcript_1643/g.2562 Transcript_1643/m.2562 type:complete len:723 (+) Transcript_1643:69-2237(+)